MMTRFVLAKEGGVSYKLFVEHWDNVQAGTRAIKHYQYLHLWIDHFENLESTGSREEPKTIALKSS